MTDFVEILNSYKDSKDVLDFIDDVQKLRFYYSTQQFEEMLKHIYHLTIKYSSETIIWNSINRNQPIDYNQAYQNAENFLRAKGFSMLIQKGYYLSHYLNQEDIAFIEKMSKVMDIKLI